MLKIKDNKIIEYSLPKVGTLKNGETVSGYDLLPIETLKKEGWLPLENIRPEFDWKTHDLKSDGYEILETKVKAKYKIVEIQERVPTQEEKIVQLEEALNILLGAE